MSTSEIVVTKRLHVSGLTPQITADDLKKRFSSFGSVKALDGLGKLDALGQNRPFAYVTLETTKTQFAKCLNLLSGTTWKGAKLRIGEAKPDFKERIIKENDIANKEDGTSPRKKRRLTRGSQGIHASDMSLVTRSSLRPGWRLTPLGRLVCPMRMRPLHPLSTSLSSGAQNKLALATMKKRKKKKKELLVRARKRLINPEDWGSTYLSGLMLARTSGSGVILPEKPVTKAQEEVHVGESPAIVVDGWTIAAQSVAISDHQLSQLPSTPRSVLPASDASPAILHPIAVNSDVEPPPSPRESQPRIDLAQETAQSLALLSSLFDSGRVRTEDQAGSKDYDSNDNWGGAESLSDLDISMREPSALHPPATHQDMDDDIEFVPRQGTSRPTKSNDKRARNAEMENVDVEAPRLTKDSPVREVQQEAPKPQSKAQAQAQVQITKLKDMFAPRPEDAGFSILGNLDLELELDEEGLPEISAPLPPVPLPESTAHQQPAHTTSTSRHPTFTYDPTRPFFFPHSLLPHSQSSLQLNSNDPRDIFSKPLTFFRTANSEEIRTRWETRKVQLTRDWKRRHREAVKSVRRRGGGGGGDDTFCDVIRHVWTSTPEGSLKAAESHPTMMNVLLSTTYSEKRVDLVVSIWPKKGKKANRIKGENADSEEIKFTHCQNVCKMIRRAGAKGPESGMLSAKIDLVPVELLVNSGRPVTKVGAVETMDEDDIGTSILIRGCSFETSTFLATKEHVEGCELTEEEDDLDKSFSFSGMEIVLSNFCARVSSTQELLQSSTQRISRRHNS
ncbi:uncharacterized protein FOMMEDRAFT_160076 [Fomitiporia mediterranea MF3/22]|uniref:uncharacterized protein n=1 Tax=Fomitiporia mediterranea (strain MF3/22) TaxID=694068 RepID=UPI0004408C69|nr:uncharacterized protein FOMMEDRAFT_160076 [Fomitiporia mediterranea MF3/22]EJC99650.1 hypothetical protein FOMMEDRAFT_160076 [Fomitiporia mediterranea MF3/22]